jgi:dTDP-4-dehydrorhamnose reductase
MKILILGAGGMAGHMLYTILYESKRFEVLGTVYSTHFNNENIELNIYDRNKLNGIIDGFQPDFVVNCIGILIKESKIHPENAVYANSFFPHYLAGLSKLKEFKLIHISTDCVFSGNKGQYTEADLKDAVDMYGLSKNIGEIIDNENLTNRTSIIGPELKKNGEGLFHWFMNQSVQIFGYKSNMWGGVTTLELSKFIKHVIEREPNLTGLLHLTNNTSISKFDLLSLMNSVYKKNIDILDDKDYVSDKSIICTRKDFDYKVPSYTKMIEEQYSFMNSHKSLYSMYL